ncbi:MAG: hypothetical protein AAGI11_20410 [Pseudomonadota bacterium]
MRKRRTGFWASVFLVVSLVSIGGCGGSGGDGGGDAEVVGTVKGKVGDVEGQWYAIKIEQNGISAASSNYSSMPGGLADYTIQAHEGRRFSISNSVSISMQYLGDRVLSSDVTYFPEQGMVPHYTSDENSVAIAMTTMEKIGDVYKLAGTAQGKLYRVASMTGDPDLSDSIDVAIAFEADAYLE